VPFTNRTIYCAVAHRAFDDEKGKALSELWRDDSTRRLLVQEASKDLLDCADFLPHHPFEQIQALIYDNSFASDEESVYVSGVVRRFIQKPRDIVPYVTEHKSLQLAERCLISCGFFKKHLEERTKRRQAPSFEFYRETGKEIFRREDVFNVADNFDSWINKLYFIFI
jgi:hypothetical protein